MTEKWVTLTTIWQSDGNGELKKIKLTGGEPVQVWLEYDGRVKKLNVTLAPLGVGLFYLSHKIFHPLSLRMCMLICQHIILQLYHHIIYSAGALN